MTSSGDHVYISLTPKVNSDLRVGRRLQDDVRDRRDVIPILRVGGESLPLRVFAERSPRPLALRHIGERENVRQARHPRADERLTEEDGREARPPKDRHFAGVEYLQLVERGTIAVTLIRAQLVDSRSVVR